MEEQLTILSPRDDATMASYYPAKNLEVFSKVQSLGRAPQDGVIYIWGAADVGTTHLLQATCHECSKNGITSVYIPFKELKRLSPKILHDLERVQVICLDDIHKLAGDSIWEEALFHLYNRMQGTTLLLSAKLSPKSIPINLPDLKSRLAWGTTYKLESLSDHDKLCALQLRAKGRGLSIPTTVGQFLLHRCARDMRKLFFTLELLDKESLAKKRKITIPFVKEVLKI